VCQGCYVSVPNNIYVRLARCTELVYCPSCGRILYLRD
jgi:predicted  nucleic acid-binding Zn-ribbon protein